MTDENRAKLRRGIEAAIGRAEIATSVSYSGPRPAYDGVLAVDLFVYWSAADDPPPFPTHKQLALSVLLGEDVPLAVLVAACEDAGVFAGGVLSAAVEKARAEERESILRPYITANFQRTFSEWEFPRQNSTRPT